MKNLGQRVLTGLFFGVVMIASILYSNWSLALILLIISVMGLREFYKMVGEGPGIPQSTTGILIGSMSLLIYIFTVEAYMPFQWLYALIPLTALIFISEMYRNSETPFINISITLAGMIYVVLPLMLLYFIGNGFLPEDEILYHRHLVLGYFILLWSNDTGAYFAGSKLGKHKLFERLSPKKTWEGFAGGMITALVAAFIVSRFFTDLNMIEWMITAAIIVIFGTAGDLVESMLKRDAGVKDSGQLLPGHGGILDRFDGLLISVPFVFFYLYLIGKFTY